MKCLQRNIRFILFFLFAIIFSVLNVLQFYILNNFTVHFTISTFTGLLMIVLCAYTIKVHLFIKRLSTFIAAANNGENTEGGHLRVLEGKLNTVLSKANNIVDVNIEDVETIANVVDVIQTSINETSKSVEQVATTIYDVAQGSSSQAQSLQETVEYIEMAAEAISEVTKNTLKVEKESRNSANLIESKEIIIQNLKGNTISTIDISKQVAEIIEEMNSKSEMIRGIVDIIGQIATQTNLLALNAAIEAARAGESGKGFAVVANEIRLLAQQSTKSSKDISDIIFHSINDTKLAAEKMESATKIICSQEDIILDIEEVFASSKSAVLGFADHMDKSSRTLNELNIAVNEINVQAQSISEIINSNAAATQEISAASEEQHSVMESILAKTLQLVELTNNIKTKFNDVNVR